MTCHEVTDKLELFIDNEISDLEKTEIEIHLESCTICTKQLEVLRSINSIGKIKAFSEPKPAYWRQLSQNIMYKIGQDEEKASWIDEILKKLKALILPEQMRYRLVGLGATAVILFFIVHIFFFRQGKFNLPIEVGVEDAIKMTKPKGLSSEPQDEVISKGNVSEKKDGLQTPRALQSIKDQTMRRKSIVDVQPKLSKKSLDQSANEFKEHDILSDDQIEVDKDKVTFLSNVPVSSVKTSAPTKKKLSPFSIQPTATSFEQKQVAKNCVRVNIDAERPSLKQEQIDDSSVVRYNSVFLSAQNMEKIHEKINIWEKYLKTQPEIEFIRKAKYEQALLYYKLAKENNSRDEIDQAIKFYLQNLELLFSVENVDSVNKKIEELNALLKKMERKE